MVAVFHRGYSQCPNGQPAGATAYRYDNQSLEPVSLPRSLRFRNFDPQTGLVTCVNLCVTIKGVIDSVSLENFSSCSSNRKL
jgi:hypothetical protein